MKSPSLLLRIGSSRGLAAAQEADSKGQGHLILPRVLVSMIALSVLTQGLQIGSMAARSFQSSPGFWWPLNFCACLSFIALHRLACRGQPRLATYGLLGVIGGVNTILLLASGVENPVPIVVFALLGLLAATLLGFRAALVALGISAAVMLLSVSLDRTGLFHPPDPVSPEHGTGFGGVVAILGLFAVMLVAFGLYANSANRPDPIAAMPTAEPSETVRTATLTRREREVAALVAQGLTNDEIGTRLFVSTRTVESHVANARRKTNSANRAELGAIAVREGVQTSAANEADPE